MLKTLHVVYPIFFVFYKNDSIFYVLRLDINLKFTCPLNVDVGLFRCDKMVTFVFKFHKSFRYINLIYFIL